MLTRLIHKEPEPVKPVPRDNIVFNKEGKIRAYFQRLCLEIHIQPDDLMPKMLDDFKSPDITKNMQINRFNNFELKRRTKIEALKKIAKQRYGNSHERTGYLSNGGTPTLALNLEELARVVKDDPNKDDQDSINKTIDQETKAVLRRHSLTNEDFRPAAIINLSRKTSNAMEQSSARTQKQGLEDSSFLTSVKNASSIHDDLLIRKKTSSIGHGFDDSKKNKFGGPTPQELTYGGVDIVKTTTKKLRESFQSDSDQASVAAGLEENFQHYLMAKLVEKGRLRQAKGIPEEQDEEFREKARQQFLEKQKKFQERMKNIEEKRAKSVKDDPWKRVVEDNHKQILKKEEQVRKKFGREIIKKLEEAERRREENNTSRLHRLVDLNKTVDEKIMMCHQKKEENDSFEYIDIHTTEKKILDSISNRERQKMQKVLQLNKSSNDAREKYEKAKEKKDVEYLNNVSHTLERIAKIHSLSPQRKKEDSYWVSKFEWKEKEQIKQEKQIFQEFKKKENKRLEQVKKHKQDLMDYIRERKDNYNQKLENIKEILNISKETNEKKYNRRIEEYQDKTKKIKEMKTTRMKQIVEIDKFATHDISNPYL